MENGEYRIGSIILIAIACVLFTMSCEQGLETGSISLQVYSEAFTDPTTIETSYNLESIVVIDPAIDGQELFVGDGAGVIQISDVPTGSYDIHPAFSADSYDITIEVNAGETTEEMIMVPRMGLYYYIVNVSSDVTALADSDVRTALSKAADRDAIVATVDSTLPVALDLLPPQLLYDGLSGLDQITEDQTAAETLLSGTSSFDFDLLYNQTSSNKHQTIATEFKSQMEALSAVGTVTLVSQDYSTWLDRMADGTFDVARMGWVLDANNPLNFFELLMSQSGYSSTTLDTLVTEAQDELDNGDLTAHAAKLVEIHDHLLDAMVVIPIYYE